VRAAAVEVAAHVLAVAALVAERAAQASRSASLPVCRRAARIQVPSIL
jgi:hypothetical protein